MDQPINGKGTGGDPLFLEKYEEHEKQAGPHTLQWHFNLWITPRFSDISDGSRLIKVQVAEMDIVSELLPRQNEFLLALLLNHESAIAFNCQEKVRIRLEIELPHVIRIRSDHIPWH